MIGVSLEIWNVALKVGVISETILQGKCVISVPRRKKQCAHSISLGLSHSGKQIVRLCFQFSVGEKQRLRRY